LCDDLQIPSTAPCGGYDGRGDGLAEVSRHSDFRWLDLFGIDHASVRRRRDHDVQNLSRE
jgi:hypothetical protein